MNTSDTSRRARRAIVGAVAITLLAASTLWAHDLFLRLEDYFVQPDSDIRIHVLNGTFSKSEGPVARNRLRSLDLVTGSDAIKLDTSAWVPRGDSTTLTIHTGAAGTYVAAASLLPRSIAIGAKDFNTYLRTDGVPDMLAKRRRDGTLDVPAKELYQKHVKAVFQVGTSRTAGFDRVLGYPAELVPLANPYELRPGAALRVRALVDGQPVANQFVVWGGRTPKGARIAQRSTRTDSSGVARITPLPPGIWYVKFIHMVPAPAGDTVNYHSKWATLTFAVAPRGTR
ncbi:MAG: DUF4198 domain-containing protein [Gemmatimonadaceae bacterium]